MMTLWSIFRSPLMIGAELTKLDDWPLSLLTNKKVLHVLSNSHGAMQVKRDNEQAIWIYKVTNDNSIYHAMFNLSDTVKSISININELDLGLFDGIIFEELWNNEIKSIIGNTFTTEVLVHGAKLYKISEKPL